MRVASWLAAVMVAGIVGCGGADAVAPTPFFESIAASYAGTLSGTSEGVALVADFGITITQSDGTLSGSYSMSGLVSDGGTPVAVQGTGALAGTIAEGHNPSVNFTVTPGGCPNRPASFSGTYDSANNRLTVVGPVQLFNQACNVVLTYPMTIVLTR